LNGNLIPNLGNMIKAAQELKDTQVGRIIEQIFL